MFWKHIEEFCASIGIAGRACADAESSATAGPASRSARARRGKLSRLITPTQSHVGVHSRNMRVESLEPRRLMAADPIHIGVVYVETDYLESDVGSDSQGDRFIVTFTGGAPGTKLTELRIRTDKDSDGLSVGDLIFDTESGGRGKGGYHPFKLLPGQSEEATAEIADGGMELILRPKDFQAGDKLIFTVDVDEVLRNLADLEQFNSRLDVIASGQEFQDSILEAKFEAPNYYESTADSIFLNDYGDPKADYGLNLPPDEGPDGNSLPNRSAAAVASVTQAPRPASVGGFVYLDANGSGKKDAGEKGIAGVRVRLEPIDTIQPQSPLTTTTGADGSYEFTGVMPGRYRIVEVDQPAGTDDGVDTAGTISGQLVGTAINPGDEIRDVQLRGGDAGINYNFGELPLGSIGGFVYLVNPGEDIDGPHDATNSTPIKGAEVRLIDQYGVTIATTHTAADGSYQFNNLHKGIYSIVEVTPEGLLDGEAHAGDIRTLSSTVLVGVGTAVDGGNIREVELPAGGKATQYNFCEIAPGSIAGQVYHDRNDNGQRDAGEEAIAGVALNLIGSDGKLVATTRTDSQGAYRFDNLAPDDYRIVESQPVGFIDGKDRVGTIGGKLTGRLGSDGDSLVAVALRQGLQGVGYDFGERKIGSLTGQVYVDFDGDRELDPNETLLEGVVIDLKDGTGKIVATTKTDANGRYRFENLLPGTYTVVEHQPSGYFEGAAMVGTLGGVVDGPNRIKQITIGSGQKAEKYDFCEQLPAELSGVVYVDRDADCVRDENEEGLGGVLVELLDETGKVVDSTRTDASGRYSFTNLRAGEYTVRETQPEGYFQGGQKAGSAGGDDSVDDRISAIPIGWGQTLTDYNFCEVLPAGLSGIVYVDRDADCVRDENEEGIAGVLIELLDNSGKVVATTTTNASGQYSFTNLKAGEYTVRETQPVGYFQGGQKAGSAGGNTSVADHISAIPIGWGQTLTDYNFCEVLPAELSGVVYVDRDADCVRDENEEGIGGVLIELFDGSGKVVATTTTNASGQYSFTNLKAGEYTVRETQPVGYFQGGQKAGSAGGNSSVADHISAIPIGWGQTLTDYNFCEVLPAELSGVVYVDRDADCVRDENEEGIAGVLIELFDDSGKVVATTTTNASGQYSFTNLKAGDYTVRETQPVGYLQGGQKAGSAGGNTSVADHISAIPIGWGQTLTDYNFCEVLPSELSGIVYFDRDADCVRDENEEGIAGVLIELLDDSGKIVSSTTTDANGRYTFTNLKAGDYTVRETQPVGYLQGGQKAGSAGGNTSVADQISAIPIGWGQKLTDYNFCEQQPGRISGTVWSNLDQDEEFDSDESPIAGVLIELSDKTGVIASTRTDAHGNYEFTGLRAGRYTVTEHQPDEYFNGGQTVGSLGGRSLQADVIGEIELAGGEDGRNYNFYELAPVTISGYVFQDGGALVLSQTPDPTTLRLYRDGLLTSDDIRLSGVVMELRDANGVLVDPASVQLGGAAGGVLRVTTNADGYYEFTGLRPWTRFSIYQAQPDGYIDSLDTAGTTGGLAINAADFTQAGALQAFLNDLAVGGDPRFDAIFHIEVSPGGTSQSNNFSEIVIEAPPEVPPWAIPAPINPEQPSAPIETFDPIAPLDVLPYQLQYVTPPIIADDEWEVSWHLSVINGGFPRGHGQQPESAIMTSYEGQLQAQQAAFRSGKDMDRETRKLSEMLLDVDLTDGRWLIQPSRTEVLSDSVDGSKIRIGHKDATALTGDFDGDGVDEAVLFIDGQWFVDLNGDGKWDKGDLWVRLGTALDRPVVGDWDGDGKDDVGIFGRRWQNDEFRIRQDPGLPDPANQRRRNLRREDLVHRIPTEQEKQQRMLMRGQDGELLADAVDHVFQYGEQVDTPVAGDWNGDGIDQIGVFRSGQWMLDEDGDGRWTSKDRPIEFGQPGDEPVVGDFDGDGIDEIGVVRGDLWIIDSDGDRKLTGNDKRMQIPRPSGDSQPIVGDFDGDDRDDPGYYQAAG